MSKLSKVLALAALVIAMTAAIAVAASITGTAGDDNLVGTSSGDNISGLAGNDKIIGQGAGDNLSGGDGNDRIYGDGRCPPGTTDPFYCDTADNGNSDTGDNIDGGNGNDYVNGNGGGDNLNGGAGADIVIGGGGKDNMNGNDGNDTLYAQDGGPDVIDCGAGTDTAYIDKAKDITKSCEVVSTSPVAAPAGVRAKALKKHSSRSHRATARR
jgi:hypothetical protein